MDRALAYTNAGGGGGGGGVGGWGKGRRRQIQKEGGCPQAAIDYQKKRLTEKVAAYKNGRRAKWCVGPHKWLAYKWGIRSW